jgi:hypothetical protein
MNLLRRSANILQATITFVLPPNEAASFSLSFGFPHRLRPLLRFLSASRTGSCQGFPPLPVPALFAAHKNLLKPAFPSCKDKGVLTGRPGA